MVLRGSARIARDDNDIAGLQCFTRDALAIKLSGPAPFDRPPDPFVIQNLNERVRISELELDQFAFDFDRLVFVVRRRKGMMGVKLYGASEDASSEKSNEQVAFHK